jgi:hypothetical protein
MLIDRVGRAARSQPLPDRVQTPRQGRGGVIARCISHDAAHASSPRVHA